MYIWLRTWNIKRAERKNEHLELLRSISKSLKRIESVIDTHHEYGSAVKIVSATRY